MPGESRKIGKDDKPMDREVRIDNAGDAGAHHGRPGIALAKVEDCRDDADELLARHQGMDQDQRLMIGARVSGCHQNVGKLADFVCVLDDSSTLILLDAAEKHAPSRRAAEAHLTGQ